MGKCFFEWILQRSLIKRKSFMHLCCLICLLLRSTLTNAEKPTSIKSDLSTESEVHQSSVARKVGIKGSGQDNHHYINVTKPETNFGNDHFANSEEGQWNLQFDPSYFATLNAANHRPVDPEEANASIEKAKAASTTSTGSSSSSTYYYSPESYGKTTHKNHQTGSFAYLYPIQSSSSSTSTTSPSSVSNDRYENDENDDSNASNDYAIPGPQAYSLPYNNEQGDNVVKRKKRPLPAYGYSEEVDDAHYYDGNEGVDDSRYYSRYHPMRFKNKQRLPHGYFVSDLTSSSTSTDNTKSQTNIQAKQPPPPQPLAPAVEYNAHDEGGLGQDYDPGDGFADLKYNTGSHVKFPSKYHYHGTGSGGFYSPPYFPTQYYPSSHGYPGDSFLSSKTGSWIGPGIAGLLFGILPLSILIASMVPAIVSVPVVSTAAVGRRKRQMDEGTMNRINNTIRTIDNETTRVLYNPALDIIADYGFSSMDDPRCLQEMFCMLTVQGNQSNSNVVQKMFYKLTKWTPEEMVKSFGMDELFAAVHINKCQETYNCTPKKSKTLFVQRDAYN